MQGYETPIDVKEKGLIWLLPPYCWSHRQIASKLNVSASVVSKWRSELVEKGLLPENEKVSGGESHTGIFASGVQLKSRITERQ